MLKSLRFTRSIKTWLIWQKINEASRQPWLVSKRHAKAYIEKRLKCRLRLHEERIVRRRGIVLLRRDLSQPRNKRSYPILMNNSSARRVDRATSAIRLTCDASQNVSINPPSFVSVSFSTWTDGLPAAPYSILLRVVTLLHQTSIGIATIGENNETRCCLYYSSFIILHFLFQIIILDLWSW